MAVASMVLMYDCRKTLLARQGMKNFWRRLQIRITLNIRLYRGGMDAVVLCEADLFVRLP